MFLESEPVFTRSDLVAYLEGRGVAGPSVEACRLGEQWRDEGLVVAVRPDLYAVVNRGRDPERFQPMSDLVATKMAPDAVVSHHSALDYWGISYSMWFDEVYSATNPAPSMVYGAMYYRGVRFPERLIVSGNQHFAVAEESYAGGTVRVTTMERTLVDHCGEPRLRWQLGRDLAVCGPGRQHRRGNSRRLLPNGGWWGGPPSKGRVLLGPAPRRVEHRRRRPSPVPSPCQLCARLSRPCTPPPVPLRQGVEPDGPRRGSRMQMGTGLLTPPGQGELLALGTARGFVPDRLEKTVRLLALADGIAAHPYLGSRYRPRRGAARRDRRRPSRGERPGSLWASSLGSVQSSDPASEA